MLSVLDGLGSVGRHVLAQVLKINPKKLDIDSLAFEDFELVGYDPHKKIAMKMAV